MITLKDIWRRLTDKKYREHYALSLLKRSVAFQIKTLRKKHCGSQMILAERSQLTQGVVSRAEDQEYGNLTFNTVGRIAAGLDMAFIGRFVPWSELAKFAQDMSEEEFASIPTFEEENAAFDAIEAIGLGPVPPEQSVEDTYTENAASLAAPTPKRPSSALDLLPVPLEQLAQVG